MDEGDGVDSHRASHEEELVCHRVDALPCEIDRLEGEIVLRQIPFGKYHPDGARVGGYRSGTVVGGCQACKR